MALSGNLDHPEIQQDATAMTVSAFWWERLNSLHEFPAYSRIAPTCSNVFANCNAVANRSAGTVSPANRKSTGR